MPLDSVPREVLEQAIAFYREFNLPILYNFARTLVDAVFNGNPDPATSAPQETNVRSKAVDSKTSQY